MYQPKQMTSTSINRNTSYVGETLEGKIRRIVANKEPIKDTAPIIYTERKDGVVPEFDIRTDRMEKALEARDLIAKNKIAKRQGVAKEAKDGMLKDQATETKVETTRTMTTGQSTQATDPNK